MTVFDIGSTLVMVILFCHAVIIMNVARESILIFIDEHQAQSLSKTLDRKNLGVDATGFFTSRNRTNEAGQAMPREQTAVSEPNPVSVHSGIASKAGEESAQGAQGDNRDEGTIYRMTY